MIGSFVALFKMHNHLDDASDGSGKAGLVNVISSSLVLTSASLEQVHQAAAKIHDAAFKKLIKNLHKEKHEYKHLLAPTKSLFQKYDKTKKKVNQQDVIKRDKKGEIVYKPITKISIEDLGKLGVANPKQAAAETTYAQAIEGRERLVDIIHEAGIEDIDIPSILSLPKWDSVSKLYGDGPVVLGLEWCHEFQTNEMKFPTWDKSLGTAGLFNTGTNPFAMYLEQNCKMPLNKSDRHGGTRWQVPWGKHRLASQRLENTAGRDTKTNKTTVMPIVMVRDPYSWMQSMCKHPYEARWPHNLRCPHLADVETATTRRRNNNGNYKHAMVKTVPVDVKYNPWIQFDSLIHFWAQWYKEYLEADYPRLLVRFEDLQFHAKELIDIVCQCAGAVPRNEDEVFRYVVDSAKWGPAHRDRTSNMVTTMIKYGTDKNRFQGMTEADKKVASSVLTPELMELFGYEIPDFTREYYREKEAAVIS
jgi:hypothetical protein